MRSLPAYLFALMFPIGRSLLKGNLRPIKVPPYRTNLSPTSSQTDIENPRSRFWIKSFPVTDPNSASIDTVVRNLDLRDVDSGFVFFNALALPVQQGQPQLQHVSAVPMDRSSVSVCSLRPRASQVNICPVEEERPIDWDRKKALDSALPLIANISAEDLLSAQFAGTPPVRIYRSFVAPRPGGNVLLETVERAANRTANQIELGLRQVLADRAAFLRNTDRSTLNSSRTMNPIAVVLDNVRSAL